MEHMEHDADRMREQKKTEFLWSIPIILTGLAALGTGMYGLFKSGRHVGLVEGLNRCTDDNGDDEKMEHNKASLTLIIGMEISATILVVAIAYHCVTAYRFFNETRDNKYQPLSQTADAYHDSQRAPAPYHPGHHPTAPTAPPRFPEPPEFVKYLGAGVPTEPFVVSPDHPLARMGYRFCPYTGAPVMVDRPTSEYADPKVYPSAN
jgi:hypothetical protein